MNFLEAHKTLKAFEGGKDLKFTLAMSGLSDKLDIFLKAYAAKNGFQALYSTLPFNTLQQYIHIAPSSENKEIFLLFPWDLVPSTDWRSGFPDKIMGEKEYIRQAKEFLARLDSRSNCVLIYIPAAIPPLLSTIDKIRNIETFLLEMIQAMGAEIMPKQTFSMASYLDNGCPIAGAELGYLAQKIIQTAIATKKPTHKVLVTDLDNVMWHGVIGEDGIDGIKHEPLGLGYKHFIYQTYLRKLKNEGVLIAAVSRNDEELAKMPFLKGKMIIRIDDFVSVIASYNAKSSQISELAKELNLGLDSFVFVDDNPIEIEEVSHQLSIIDCVLFPSKDEDIPDFYRKLSSYFNRDKLTAEDKDRTEMYKRRLKSIIPSNKSGSDITIYLKSLEMELSIFDRTLGDKTRAVQLINKTNQFNLNGIRLTDEEIVIILNDGGRIFTASLIDKHGEHGEILSCLLTQNGKIISFVMSCRVFQRRIEYAFMVWLISQGFNTELSLEYIRTERNEPIRKYLDDESFIHHGNGLVTLESTLFLGKHEHDYSLFKVFSNNTMDE